MESIIEFEIESLIKWYVCVCVCVCACVLVCVYVWIKQQLKQTALLILLNSALTHWLCWQSVFMFA